MKSNVQNHYNEISESYNKDLNLYCQNRFADIIKRYIKKYAKRKILDVGCGTGFVQDRISKDIIGMDITLSLLKKNKNKYVCGNAEMIPFTNNVFDFIYSINVLEHVSNPLKVIGECKRVLKKNRILVLITPNKGMELALDLAEKLKLKIPEGPHRFLSNKELQKLVGDNDMKIISAEKIILLPLEAGILNGIFEKSEKLFSLFCFFNLVICEK